MVQRCEGVGPADELPSVACCQTVESKGLLWATGDSGAGTGIGGGDSDWRASATYGSASMGVSMKVLVGRMMGWTPRITSS